MNTQVDGPDLATLDRLQIVDVIQRERHARDMRLWDEMASCFNVDSIVDISWFKGSGAAFAEASKQLSARVAPQGQFTFHEVGHSAVRVRGARAVAITPCIVHLIVQLDGVEVDVVAHSRMYSRVANATGAWLISGIRSVYVQDMMIPLDPTRPPRLNAADLAAFRRSYRFLSYVWKQRGQPADDHCPGVDRPDLVKALVDAEEAWFNGL